MDKFEQMVEAIEETEDMVECKECFDLFPKAECTKIDHGYICPTCGREQPRNLDDISFTDITTDLYSQEFPDVMDYDSEFKAKVEADRAVAMDVDSVVDALIKDEYDAIDGYEVADEVVQHSDLEAEEKEDLLDTIDHIKEEEEEHIDELKDAADLEIKDLEDEKEDPKDEDPKEEIEEIDEALGVGAGLALGGAAIGAGIVGSKLLDSKESEEGAEDLDELFDTNLELGFDGGSGNKVDVLSSHEPEKEGEEKLDELFDTDIKLGLDAGDNNDVSVLSPLNASHDEEEEGEELKEDYTGTPEERTTHLDKEDSDKGTLEYDNSEKAKDDKCILTEGPLDFFKNKKAVKALDKLFGAAGYVLIPSEKELLTKHKAEFGLNSPFKTFADAQAKAKAASQLFPESTLYIVPIVPSNLPAEVRDQMDIKAGKYGPILAAYLGGKENAADKNRKQIGLNLQKMLKAYEVFVGKDAAELPIDEEPRAEEAPAETPATEEPATEETPAVKTEANKKMKAALKAAGMSQADIDKLFKSGVIPTIRKALLGEGLTLEDLRDEETVVCDYPAETSEVSTIKEDLELEYEFKPTELQKAKAEVFKLNAMQRFKQDETLPEIFALYKELQPERRTNPNDDTFWEKRMQEDPRAAQDDFLNFYQRFHELRKKRELYVSSYDTEKRDLMTGAATVKFKSNDAKDKLMTESIYKATERKPIPEGMTIEQLVEENEETVVCGCCAGEHPRAACRQEVDLGWLCEQCEQAITSRGEELSFTEDLESATYGLKNMTSAMKESILNLSPADFAECVDSSRVELWGLEEPEDGVAQAVLIKSYDEVSTEDVQSCHDEMLDLGGMFTFSFTASGKPSLYGWNTEQLRKLNQAGFKGISFDNPAYEEAIRLAWRIN
jgi:hypothetical protein